jgi:hypothetical protein
MLRKWYIVCEVHDEFFLDLDQSPSHRTGKGQRVVVAHFTRAQTQHWEIDDSDDSIISIDSKVSVDIGSVNGVAAGNDIILWPFHRSSNQLWVYDADTNMIFCPRNALVLEVFQFATGAKLIAGKPQIGKPEQR